MSFPNVSVGNPDTKAHSLTSQIIKQIILPELQREVNQDQNFAPLRQVYSGMLLATWFKRTLKQSLLGQIYANKNKIKGLEYKSVLNGGQPAVLPTGGHVPREAGYVSPSRLPSNEGLNVKAPQGNHLNDVEVIYQRYLQAYKKGVFNFIKEDTDRLTNETIPRKYFSGGEKGFANVPIQTIHSLSSNQAMVVARQLGQEDQAMVGLSENSPASSTPDSRFHQLLLHEQLQEWRKKADTIKALALVIRLKGSESNNVFYVDFFDQEHLRVFDYTGRRVRIIRDEDIDFSTAPIFEKMPGSGKLRLGSNEAAQFLLDLEDRYPDAAMRGAGVNKAMKVEGPEAKKDGEMNQEKKPAGVLREYIPQTIYQVIEPMLFSLFDTLPEDGRIDLEYAVDVPQNDSKHIIAVYENQGFIHIRERVDIHKLFQLRFPGSNNQELYFGLFNDMLEGRLNLTSQELIEAKKVERNYDTEHKPVLKAVVYKDKIYGLQEFRSQLDSLFQHERKILSLIAVDSKENPYLYRAVDFTEWKRIKERGYFVVPIRTNFDEKVGSQVVHYKDEKGYAGVIIRIPNKEPYFRLGGFQVTHIESIVPLFVPGTEIFVSKSGDEGSFILLDEYLKSGENAAMNGQGSDTRMVADRAMIGELGPEMENFLEQLVNKHPLSRGMSLRGYLDSLPNDARNKFLEAMNKDMEQQIPMALKLLSDDIRQQFYRGIASIENLTAYINRLQSRAFYGIPVDQTPIRNRLKSIINEMTVPLPEGVSAISSGVSVSKFIEALETDEELHSQLEMDYRGLLGAYLRDEAMVTVNGGIDLNAANLHLVIKRDGNGVPLPFAQQDLAQLSNIQGLDPVILSIKPASQTALFSELVAH